MIIGSKSDLMPSRCDGRLMMLYFDAQRELNSCPTTNFVLYLAVQKPESRNCIGKAILTRKFISIRKLE